VDVNKLTSLCELTDREEEEKEAKSETLVLVRSYFGFREEMTDANKVKSFFGLVNSSYLKLDTLVLVKSYFGFREEMTDANKVKSFFGLVDSS
jgi:hypothetical protein